MRGLQLLFVFLPVAMLAQFARIVDIFVFAASALAIIPLTKILDEATEVLAEKTGQRIGGLLNVTLGNAVELIITLMAIRAEQMQLVLASITSSIMGNLLLVWALPCFLMASKMSANVRPSSRGHRCHHGHSGPDRHERAFPLQPIHLECHARG